MDLFSPEEQNTSTRSAGNGLILLYIFFTIGAMSGGMGLKGAILGILGMAILTYAITPAYPKIIEFYNYLFFTLLFLSVAAMLFGFWPSLIPSIITVLGPFLVIGIPLTHIFYLILKKKKEHIQLPEAQPPPVKNSQSSVSAKKAGRSVFDRLGKRLALVCGYETLTAKRALGYLLSRTLLSWIAGSVVLGLLAHFGVFG